MNFSMKWLNEFVGVSNIDPKEFCEKMTKTGSRVISYKKDGENLKNIVVGKILFIDEHPFEDRLLVCKVDVGQEKPLQIVTNAQNLRAGNLVPVALDGAILADGTKIESGKVRNILSHGMFCSNLELGVTKKELPNIFEDEVIVLENNCDIGMDIRDAINFNDTKYEIEISNIRSDCFSVIGMSREISATYNKLLRLHTPAIKEYSGDINDILKVKVEVSDFCEFYSLKAVKNIKVGESPKWLQDRIKSMGIKPVNNIVDVTNYVMLEYGQPINVYDLKSIKDGTIIIRKANIDEKVSLLDNREVNLSEDDIVISDSDKALAIAGIAKSQKSCITGETSTVVFEAASFNKNLITSMSKRLNLDTESSLRFKNGVDFNNCVLALQRVCEIIEMLNIGDIIGNMIVEDYSNHELKKFLLDCNWINKFLNTDIQKEEMKRTLRKIGCSFDDDMVIIPSFRKDLNNISDIASEILRFYGYENIPESRYKTLSIGRYSKFKNLVKNLRKTLLYMGLDEIKTNLFIENSDLDKLMIKDDSTLRSDVFVVGTGEKRLKTTAIGNLISEIKFKDIKNVFEITKEYSLNDKNEKVETNKCLISICGDELDFLDIKGIAEILLDVADIRSYEFKHENLAVFDKDRSASIISKNECIGELGELDSKVMHNYGLNTKMLILKLDLDILNK